MKKIFKQWFIGLILSLYGALIIASFIIAVSYFVSVINSTGFLEFVAYAVGFICNLALSMFMPYVLFKQIENGVKDKYK